MDLSSLNSTLPPDLADAEREMGDKFRAAALSITTLYKSSLTFTKQAYQVGYSAALTDVLANVQSYIGSGEDAAHTLTRLMDWAEARQTAIAAFEEDDDGDVARRGGPTTASRFIPHRPASAPVEPQSRRDTTSSLKDDMAVEAASSDRRAHPHALTQSPNTPTITDSTPDSVHHIGINSSPISVSSPSVTRPFAIPTHRLQRSGASTRPQSSGLSTLASGMGATNSGGVGGGGNGGNGGGGPPTSHFNFSIPALSSLPPLELPPVGDSAQNIPVIGSKRPIIDSDMDGNGAGLGREGPSTPARRAAKRRSMVMSQVKSEEGEERGERGERRRGGRRGHGGGGGHGTGQGAGI